MRHALGWAGKSLIVVACLAYQYSVHASLDRAGSGVVHTMLLWTPLALVATWVLLRSRHKAPWAAALIVIGALVYLAEHQERLGLAATSGLSHAAAYLFLMWYFGHTLARGSVPLVTRFARSLHGELAPAMEAFMRRVTAAWCVFFAGQLAVSALLFLLAPLHVWSLFVNVLNLPLLTAMFLGQFAYRAIRHPGFPRASPWQAMQAFHRHASASNGAESR